MGIAKINVGGTWKDAGNTKTETTTSTLSSCPSCNVYCSGTCGGACTSCSGGCSSDCGGACFMGCTGCYAVARTSNVGSTGPLFGSGGEYGTSNGSVKAATTTTTTTNGFNVNVGGTWKTSTSLRVNVGGSWKEAGPTCSTSSITRYTKT